jgi:26S proteasome regulatory subunit N2
LILDFRTSLRVSLDDALRMASSSRYVQKFIVKNMATDLLAYMQAIGIALESQRFDVISGIYEKTKDVSLLSYTMEAVLDTGFSLSYRDQVLNFLLPLFPKPTVDTKSTHMHALTRLLVTLGNPSLAVSLIKSLVPHEELLAYQFAFDLVEGGAQDFLETVRNELPEGESVSI